MTTELIYTVGLIAILTILWGVEAARHRHNLSRVPIRIHINGTRGKSSTTRLISGALRAGGMKVLTKTTGTAAALIFPDGHEEPIQRAGPANIGEQRKVVALAAELGVDALVIECMALQPFYQKITEDKIIRATAAVITNARADHLDVMGPTTADVADALSGIIPKNGILFTAEDKMLDRLRRNAEKVGAKVFQSTPNTVKDMDMGNFSYVEHKENVALALLVAEHFDIKRDVALKGMWEAPPDPGVLKFFNITRDSVPLRFANAFAANDPDSTERAWRFIKSRFPNLPIWALVNNRSDRLTRTVQLTELAAEHIDADRFFLVGTATGLLKINMVRKGVPKTKIVDLGGRSGEEIWKRLIEEAKSETLIVGIGNIGGAGHDIVDWIEENGDGVLRNDEWFYRRRER